jgi:hypothetical protein
MTLIFHKEYETVVVDVERDGRDVIAIIVGFLRTGYHLIGMEGTNV